MSIAKLLQRIRTDAPSVSFPHIIETIDAHYHYTPTPFTNGIGDDRIVNAAGANEGACRIFAFAQLNHLNETETLTCFGQFYRDVQATPDATDHANIRAFMRHGWQGIRFEGIALTPKNTYMKQ